MFVLVDEEATPDETKKITGAHMKTAMGAGTVDTSGTPVDNDFAKFTDADTIEGRSYAEVKADLNLEIGTDVLAEQTIGIADDNLVEMDDAGPAAVNDYCKLTANGIVGRTYTEVRTDINVANGADVTGSNAPQAHKDLHDPNDGSDAVDTANAAEISVVVGAGTGTSHSLARADHVHAINHAITDNHLVTIDGTTNSGEYAKFTANGLEGKTLAEAMADLSGDAGAAFDWNGQNITKINSAYLTEQAAADADVAGDGQLWVKTATPNELWFTDDAGTDAQLGLGAAHAILDGSTHSDSVADAVTRGSIIYGNATPKWDELVVGTNGQVLTTDGTDISWGAAGSGDVTGPASSTDNEIARQHSTTGKVLQTYTSNPPTISDTGDVNIDGDLDVENIVASGNVDGRDVSADGTKLDNVVSNTQAITHAITDNKTVTVDGTTNAPVNGDYTKWTANGVEGKSAAEVKTDLSLNNVENTAHSSDAHTMTIDGIDVSAHDVATTGVHGAGANTILYSDHTADADAHGEPVVTCDTASATADDLAFSIVGGAGIDTSGATSVVTISGEAASDTNAGIVELATIAETNTGTSTTLAVTPDGLEDWTGSAQITAVGTLASGDVTAQVSAATTTLAGKSELATAAEINTGTDAGRTITPDTLAGSTLGKRVFYIKVLANDTAVATGDGKAYVTIPTELNGMNLVDADAAVYTVSSSGTPTWQIHNLTDTSDMLSTVITCDANELNSYTAATQPVINAAEDDVVTGDIIRIDCDLAGTGTKGCDIILSFQLP